VNEIDPLGLSDYIFFKPGSDEYTLAAQMHSDGFNTVSAHGFPGSLSDDRSKKNLDPNSTAGTKNISPEDLAKMMLADPTYNPSKPIFLNVCGAGAVPPIEGGPSYAQRLADALNNDVIASFNDVNNVGFRWPGENSLLYLFSWSWGGASIFTPSYR
jgi:hypothetical protein